jgi:hypothetical protein
MYAKMLMAWAAIVICLSVSVQGQSQYDPLGSDIFTLPHDMRQTSSQDAPKVYIDPNADPLNIDSLMRQLDTEHTTEYLDRISGRAYLSPFVPIAQELQGNWRLDLLGGMPGKVDLLLVQNRDAVFGRGVLSLPGSTNDISASGWTAKDVLYLDLVNAQEMILYRCTLTMSRDYLSGSFNAYDAQGRAWSGTIQGGRPA